MRILLTGREGQVARSLLEKTPDWPDLKLVPAGRPEVDLAEPGSIARVIRAVVPDLVINAAAYTAVDQAEDEPDLAYRINAEAAGEAAAAAREMAAGFIQISTEYVFDGQATEPYDEEVPTNPLSASGRSKLDGEEAETGIERNQDTLRLAIDIDGYGLGAMWLFERGMLHGMTSIGTSLGTAGVLPEL